MKPAKPGDCPLTGAPGAVIRYAFIALLAWPARPGSGGAALAAGEPRWLAAPDHSAAAQRPLAASPGQVVCAAQPM